MKNFFFITLLVWSSIAYSQNSAEVFPGWLEDAELIYHPPSKAMLLIGGSSIVQDSIQSDVWKWTEKGWSKIAASGPGARSFFKGGLNGKTNEINMFSGGGLGRFNSSLGDLWKFDGKKWSRIMNNDIGARDHFKMVYADHLNAFVFYGGSFNHQPDTITRLMQDGKFTELTIAGTGFRSQSAMAYDKHRKKLVLYGGAEKSDELWEFDGKKWEKIVTAMNPGIKMYHHMAYDENLKAVVLHGGQVNHRPFNPENLTPRATWLWDGKTWKKIAEEKIFPVSIGYHPIRKSILAYGFDSGDDGKSRSLALWELKDNAWTKIADYGIWDTMSYLESFIKQNPSNSNAQYVYAVKLRQQKRFPESEIVYKKLPWERMPERNYILMGMIEVFQNQNKLAETEEYIGKLENFGEKRRLPTMYYNLACAYALAGKADRAFTCLNKAVDFGYETRKEYESDSDLESLKSDSRWTVLLSRLK